MDNIGRKIKITHITRFAYPHVGGIEAVINQINDCLSDETFEKEVLCCSNTDKSSVEKSVKYTRTKYFWEIFNNTISLSFLWKLSRVNTDILHYHMPFIFAVICHFIARPKYKKLYITYHSSFKGYEKVMKPFWGILKRFYKNADKIHILAPNIIDYDNFLLPYKEKCAVIPFGINLSQRYEEENVNKIKEAYSSKKILLCIGRLMKIKGYQYAIEAMKQIDDAVLLIIGDGPYKDLLNELILSCNLGEKVKLLGEINDEKIKSEYFNACDLLIFPSTKDMFGIVQAEAMRYSKPVINTKLGTGVNYVSVDRETGISVEPANSEQLARAINELLNNENLYYEYGKNAKLRAEALFDIEKIKAQYRDLYTV